MGPLELGKRPALAAVVTREDDLLGLEETVLRDIDVFEIRADMFPRPTIAAIRPVLGTARETGKAILLTIRSPIEGGRAVLSDAQRSALFRELSGSYDALDVEVGSEALWPALSELCRRENKLLIGSFHDFSSTPDEETMDGMMRKAFHRGADVFKLACMSKVRMDVVRLLEFTSRNAERGIVTLSMGPWGTMTRFVAPAFGSLLTYGFLSEASAPGQLSVPELAVRLREFLPSRLG